MVGYIPFQAKFAAYISKKCLRRSHKYTKRTSVTVERFQEAIRTLAKSTKLNKTLCHKWRTNFILRGVPSRVTQGAGQKVVQVRKFTPLQRARLIAGYYGDIFAQQETTRHIALHVMQRRMQMRVLLTARASAHRWHSMWPLWPSCLLRWVHQRQWCRHPLGEREMRGDRRSEVRSILVAKPAAETPRRKSWSKIQTRWLDIILEFTFLFVTN